MYKFDSDLDIDSEVDKVTQLDKISAKFGEEAMRWYLARLDDTQAIDVLQNVLMKHLAVSTEADWKNELSGLPPI